MKNLLKILFLVLTSELAGLGALAQAPGSTGPMPSEPTAVPIDGGASLLLAGGLAYGLRRLSRQGR